MSKRLLVEGLDWGVTDAQLARVFAPFGDLDEAKIAQDWETGRSRGFGYVTFKDSGDAEAAIAGLDGQKLAGKTLRVMVAPEQAPRSTYRSGDFDRVDGPTGRGGGYRSADFTPPPAPNDKPRTDRKVYRSADFGYVDTKAAPEERPAPEGAPPAPAAESPAPAAKAAPAKKARPTPGAELDQEEEVNRAKFGGWNETDDNDGGINRGGGGGKTFG
ncbi:MAG: hypothetical protein IT385_01950 [Deltaproteobacteria bacterium]|nr:hypothetical protein [Deltaproteobacteria bacterium]